VTGREILGYRWHEALASDPACWSWPVSTKTWREAQSAADTRTCESILARWQSGRCAACGSLTARLVRDHDHKTGLIRGLLCCRCNNREPRALWPHPAWLHFAKYRWGNPAMILGIRCRYKLT
jgi:hypothetical protein